MQYLFSEQNNQKINKYYKFYSIKMYYCQFFKKSSFFF